MNSSTFGTQSLLAEATALIDYGVAVDLLDLTANSTSSMRPTRNQGTVETLLEALPEAHLVIPLTQKSGMAALAVDPEDGGLDSLRLLLDKGEIPTQTCIVVTAEGISYLLFRFEGPRARTGVIVGPGLRLIADQGFIVVPPRMADNGSEGRWKQGHHPAEMPIAELPERLAALL